MRMTPRPLLSGLVGIIFLFSLVGTAHSGTNSAASYVNLTIQKYCALTVQGPINMWTVNMAVRLGTTWTTWNTTNVGVTCNGPSTLTLPDNCLLTGTNTGHTYDANVDITITVNNEPIDPVNGIYTIHYSAGIHPYSETVLMASLSKLWGWEDLADYYTGQIPLTLTTD